MPILKSALGDIKRAWKLRSVWMELATEDTRDQHRNTIFGSVWQLLNYLAFAGVFVVAFSSLTSFEQYPAYVATGLLVWLFISELLSNSVMLFLREQGYIKGTNLPISLYIMKLSAQFWNRLIYYSAGCVFILVVSGVYPSVWWLVAIAGLMLVAFTAPAVVTVCAIIGAYLPDLSFVMSNLVRLGLFLTPVFWIPGNGGIRDRIFNDFNPFTYYLSIVRDPVLNSTFAFKSFMIAGSISLAFWSLAIIMLGALRKKIVFLLQ